jgi:beta-lactamase class A
MPHKSQRLACIIILALLTAQTLSLGAGADNLRIGIAMLDAAGKIVHVQMGNDRFPMCSTFKFLAVADVLQRVNRGDEKLDRFIKYDERDILDWAPVTKQHLRDGGMTLEALCFAAIAYSDNTAANLLLKTLDGPAGLTTKFIRSLGDPVTRLDRKEPELNNVAPGDERDTTTPIAMLRDMQKILLGDVLSETSRKKLESWMVQNTTGAAMIRAGVPNSWSVGDKTGNAGANSNDLAIIREPGGQTILLCVFVEAPGETPEKRANKIAAIARELIAPH